MKLGSILRVADALDRGHTQRVTISSINRKDEELVLVCNYRGDISLERIGLAAKANMFEEVFGFKVVIQ